MTAQDQKDQKVVTWLPVKNHSLLLICLCALSYPIMVAQTLPGGKQQQTVKSVTYLNIIEEKMCISKVEHHLLHPEPQLYH
jgi:hypothetical protein